MSLKMNLARFHHFYMSKTFFLLVSAAFFLFCLTQPAVNFERVCKGIHGALNVAGMWQEPIGKIEILGGLYLLSIGGFGLLFAQLGAVGWGANLLYLSAFVLSLDGTTCVLQRRLAIASLTIAIVSLPMTNWFPVLADEGGVCFLSAISPQVGYWLWLAAIAALCGAVFASPLTSNLNEQPQIKN